MCGDIMKARAEKIADGVYWAGVLDWDIRNYHGYTLQGTTYNAYLVFGDEGVALIDNSYPGTFQELMARMEDAFNREGREMRVDFIVQNHVEKDHSGVLVELHRRFPEAEIHCTEVAVEGLLKHYPALEGTEFRTAKTGDSIDLGGRTLTFLEAPLLHWPDSMFTFLDTGILFSNDAFGQHLCYPQRLDTEIPEYILMDAAKKFYANLITPLSKLVLRKFDDVKELGLLDKIRMIAPSHGQIWTEPMKIIEAYTAWATGKVEKKVTVIYDTMHHSTAMMAHAIAEGAMSEGADVRVYYLHEDDRSEIVKDILDSHAIALGAPAIYDEPYPSVGDLLMYLRGLKFNRTGQRRAMVFGSMGGRGGATGTMQKLLTDAGFDVMEADEIYYVPNNEELDACFEAGRRLAGDLNE